MPDAQLRFAQRQLLQNDLLLACERANRLGLEDVASLVSMALIALAADDPELKNKPAKAAQ